MAKMIKCPYCAGDMPEDATICPSCGGPAQKSDAAVGQQPYFGKQGTSSCPSCNAQVGAGDIVCVKCGANLLTGQKAVQEQAPAKRDFQGVLNGIKIAAVVLFVMACGAVIFVAATHLLHDPVGNARREARNGNLEQASEILREYLQRSPDDVDAQFLLGQIYWQGQHYDRAWEVFESVARQGGAHDREAAMLSLLAMERMPGADNRQRQASLLRSLIEQRYPDDVELLKLLALVQGVEHEYQGHRASVESLRALGAELSPVLLGLARALAGDLDAATLSLQRALGAQPDEGSVAAALGFVHAIRGQEAPAVDVLEQASETAPDIDALVNLQLGALLMQRGQYGRALPLLTAAKTARPEDERAVFLHALCLKQNNLLAEALVALEDISGGTSDFAGLAALEITVIYLERGDYDRAATYIRRAGEAGITTARQATIYGSVHAMQGDMNQAEQAYRRAISIQENYPAARLELGLLLISRGAVAEGLAELDRYLELAEGEPAKYRANEIEVLATQIKETTQ